MNLNANLKVLHVTASIGGGGAETMLCNLVEGMADTGVDSVIVSVGAADETNLAARAKKAATGYHELGAKSYLRGGAFGRLAQIIREERPDVVQTWMHKADLFGGAAARKARTGAKIVWGIHARDIFAPEGYPAWRTNAFRKALAVASKTLPDRIISCSQAAIESHAAMGYPRHKMVWIGNGIDTHRFAPRPDARAALRADLGIPSDAPVVGFAGRFAPVKDVPTLLRAAALLMRERPDAHLVLCGDGIEAADDRIRAGIEALPDRSRLRTLPFRPDMENVYPAFDLTALTSLSEAYPMSLIESLACGVPAVSTEVGDAARIIGAAGKTAPVGEAEAIGKAWLQILALPAAERRALSAEARSRAVCEFSLPTCVLRYRALYRELAAEKRGAIGSRTKPQSQPAHALS